MAVESPDGRAPGEEPIRPAGDDRKKLREDCDEFRDELTPKETADCAGADLEDEYDNEEDGGT